MVILTLSTPHWENWCVDMNGISLHNEGIDRYKINRTKAIYVILHVFFYGRQLHCNIFYVEH